MAVPKETVKNENEIKITNANGATQCMGALIHTHTHTNAMS